MAHEIRIKGVADFKDIDKGVKNLNQQLKGVIPKEGIKVFHGDTLNVMNGLNVDLTEAYSSLKNMRVEAVKLSEVMKDGSGQKTQNSLLVERLALTKKALDTEKQIKGLKGGAYSGGMGGSSGGGSGGSGGGEAAGGAMSLLMKNPVVAAIVAGGALVGGASIGRASAGFDKYKSSVPDILKLSAQGTKYSGNSEGTPFGFNDSESIKQQLSLNSSFGRTTGAKDTNRLQNSMAYGRNLGLDPSEISGAGNALRQVGGTEQAMTQMSQILASATQKGLDKSQASHYLEASTDLLTELNKNGATNTDRLMSIFGSVAGKNKMSPEQLAKTFKTMDSAISQSEGENNTFYQNAYGRQGLGNGTMLGTGMAVRQGLNGVDSAKLSGQVGGTGLGRDAISAIKEMGLDAKDFNQRAASGIIDELKRSSGDTSTKEGRARLMQNTEDRFGTKDVVVASRILDLLERMKNKTATAKDTAELKTLTDDPTKVWQTKMLAALDKRAENTQKAEANAYSSSFELGDAASGIFNMLTNTMAELDKTLKNVLLGITGPSKGLSLGDMAGSAADSAKSGVKNLLGNFTGDADNNSLNKFYTKPSGSLNDLNSGKAPAGFVKNDLPDLHLKETEKQTAILNKISASLTNRPPVINKNQTR